MDPKTPSINDFLDIIDPDKTIDRNKAMLDIGIIIFSKAIDETKNQLPPDRQKELDTMIQNNNPDPQKIIDFYKNSGQDDLLAKAIANASRNIYQDYIKTHLEALNETTRKKVFTAFPALLQP